MKIKKDTPCIFVRLVDFEKNNYLLEHIKTLENNKYVNLLKMGKPIKKDFMDKIYKENGILILKETKRSGNNFYAAVIESGDIDEYIYPEYYNEMFKIRNLTLEYTKINGFWFKIKKIIKMENEVVKNFVTISSNKNLLECGTRYNQVPQFYVKAVKDIEI